jgi:transcriptional regulator with XRE-family HTH domain
MSTPVPLPVERALIKLGQDLSLARRRRKLTQASLAERIGASTMTVRRMEKGNPLIPLQYFARALHVFGELGRLSQLLDTAEDTIGLSLMDEGLPKRIRKPKLRPGQAEPGAM